MLTRIEINGFKTFENFALDLVPLTAVVGPNASGKSNLFDAIRFLSLLSQFDIRSAMQDLRGLPEELFRQTSSGPYEEMSFALEVLLPKTGVDSFGTSYKILAQRLRYELDIHIIRGADGAPRGVNVRREVCRPMAKKDDSASFLKRLNVTYKGQASPFIRISESGDAIEVRQDGALKRGKPVKLSLKDASRTALSTITTAEFPHLYALREMLSGIRFLELNPKAARSPNDRFEDRSLRPDGSNLSAVLARLQEESADDLRPDGVISDIAADLSSLIPSVKRIRVVNDASQRQYAFDVEFYDSLRFSSRVISDGTLRLLALLTILNDPVRKGILCFEEPENGVHEGRVPMLIEILRESTAIESNGVEPTFQVLINTHSPKVMNSLKDSEIVAADIVYDVDPTSGQRVNRTRMRTNLQSSQDLVDREKYLTRHEVERLLQKVTDAA